MIKTIKTDNALDFDKQVNEFEKSCIYSTGVSRVFATQTHFIQNEGCTPVYVAVIFYKEVPK